MQPASETKHIPQLPYEFHGRTFLLNQRDDHGVTNGTTLWLGGQVLSYYLAFVLESRSSGSARKTAIELGSGIGLTAYVLLVLGLKY
jgi:predicted nicotinamide N-methyase